MSLDATHTHLTKCGTVTVTEGGEIRVAGFEAQGASCRDVAVLACVYAIGRLQQHLNEALQKPGGGSITVD